MQKCQPRLKFERRDALQFLARYITVAHKIQYELNLTCFSRTVSMNVWPLDYRSLQHSLSIDVDIWKIQLFIGPAWFKVYNCFNLKRRIYKWTQVITHLFCTKMWIALITKGGMSGRHISRYQSECLYRLHCDAWNAPLTLHTKDCQHFGAQKHFMQATGLLISRPKWVRK